MTNDETLLDTLNQKLLSVANNYGFNEELIEKQSYKQMFLEKKNKEIVN